jgi:hypothetical protein
VWPAWPYLSDGTLPETIGKELGNSDKSVREIRWRLKQFRYPYLASNAKKPKTLYEHAKSAGILEELLTPPLLFDIRVFWRYQRYDFYQKKLRIENKSEYGQPMALHDDLMCQLSTHLEEIDGLVAKASGTKRPDAKAWLDGFNKYRNALLKQLLVEAAIVYPQVQRHLKPAKQIHREREKIRAQVSLFEKFNAVIKQKSLKGLERHRFAYHLVALICTPRDTIKKHRLRPTPVTVRKNIENSKKIST